LIPNLTPQDTPEFETNNSISGSSNSIAVQATQIKLEKHVLDVTSAATGSDVILIAKR